jgi:alpha-galactosidase
VRLTGGSASQAARLAYQWDGSECAVSLTNDGSEPLAIREVVLFAGRWPYPSDTPLYAEGLQMLSQYDGTLGAPHCFGGYADALHYHIPQAAGADTVYSLLLLSPPATDALLLAFAACRRFVGAFRLYPDGSFEIVADTEGLVLEPGECWELEPLVALAGPERETLLAALATHIERHHPRRRFPTVPTGWCSWYHYYADVTEEDILANMSAIVQGRLPLEYVQIDDGYEAYMGDWLTAGERFPNGIARLIGQIRGMGLQPALWVAPFIAEERSQLFQQHPDWFMQDPSGRPLRSNTVSFGGWRNGPWCCLDGTHPRAQAYLEQVFATMRQEWGVSYFKLEANFWGAMHGAQLYDPRATRIEAYRRGMAAVLRGAGDAFVLGCNAPMWGSLGLVDGMRVTNDIDRSGEPIRAVAHELFARNWQHGRLWINDPDCLLLEDITQPGRQQVASAEAYRFHASAILASGGMVLSGDDLQVLSPERLAWLAKLLPPLGVAARFEGLGFRVGRTALEDRELLFVFNWDEEPLSVEVALPGVCEVRDFWDDRELGIFCDSIAVEAVPPHSARVLVAVPSGDQGA